MNMKPSQSASQLIKDGWFSEIEAMWPGQKFSLQVENVLFNGKSDFQDILVFQSTTYGKVLVLDGVIQLSERDEFAYQEMIAHLPLFSHKAPKKVLIVGGGDGGVLREVVKHACVEHIDMCEIDQQVVEVSKRFFPTTMAVAFEDPRLNLMFADAAKFLQDSDPAQYDVIICDSSDPVGPAEVLFQPQFYESMLRALKPGGVLCTQGECQWLHLDLITSVVKACADIFGTVEYAYTAMPTYPSGQLGFILCSVDEEANICVPARYPSPEMQEQMRYYSSEMHRAAFVLPAFANRAVATAKGEEPELSRTDPDSSCNIL